MTGSYSQNLGWTVDQGDLLVTGSGGENGHANASSSYDADMALSASGQWAVADGTAQSDSGSLTNTSYSASGSGPNVSADNEMLNHGTQSGWSRATTNQFQTSTAANGSWVQTASSSLNDTKSENRYNIYTTGGINGYPSNASENQDLSSDVVVSNGQTSANSSGSGNDHTYLTPLYAPSTYEQWQDQWSMAQGGVNTVSGSCVDTYNGYSASYAGTQPNAGFGGQAGLAGPHSPGLQPPAVANASLSGEMTPPPPPVVQTSVPPTVVQTINPGTSHTGGGAGAGGDGGWLNSYSNWFNANVPGGQWWSSKAGSVIYSAERSAGMSNATIANQSDGALLAETIAVSVPVGVGLFIGGEALLGVGSFGGTLGGGAAAAEGAVAEGTLTEGAAAEGAAMEGTAAEATEAEASEEAFASCFPAGTPVATAAGQFPIETIKAGDEVWAYDLIHSCWTLRTVLKTFVRDYDGSSATITVLGEEIEATSLHPFWVVTGEDLAGRPIRGHLARVPEGATTSGRWVDAVDVRVGDELLLRDGRMMPVQAVRSQPYHDKVYNVHVEDLQCYAVGPSSVLAHNMNENAGQMSTERFVEGEANANQAIRSAEGNIRAWTSP